MGKIMAQIILVGGPTGIGKSRFIDSLIEQENLFLRPKSYTTRPRRSDENRDEYEYVSFDEFEKLRINNKFVTVDEIYGNYYAMAYKSITEILQSQRIVIKEIHPKNHAKLKNILTDTISVLLLPKSLDRFWKEAEHNSQFLSSDRLARFREDQEFYNSLDPYSYPFDIVLTIDLISTPNSLKDYFLYSLVQKISTSALNLKDFDTINQLGYDLIAEEFSDDKRITTANFHDLSLTFFKSQIEQYARRDQPVLDLGSGRGHLVPILQENFSTVVVIDISPQMLSFIKPHSSGLVKVIGSAFNLPFAEQSFNFVVSSLADPFLRKEALNEVFRILVNNGVFIFNSPSKIWSDAIRQSDIYSQASTKFMHSSGLVARVCSFTYTDDELRQLIVSCGFQIEKFEVAYGRELSKYSRIISPALTQAASRLFIELDDLPILQMVTVRKKA